MLPWRFSETVRPLLCIHAIAASANLESILALSCQKFAKAEAHLKRSRHRADSEAHVKLSRISRVSLYTALYFS